MARQTELPNYISEADSVLYIFHIHINDQISFQQFNYDNF
jgi:hypothetical protein